MIEHLSYVIGKSKNPYLNLSIEEYLLDTVRPGQLILYLWQNERTVVIGKNQNAWKECRFQQLEADGGHLARRLSGGGAVFHDLGNLNFTFLADREFYDIQRQLDVIEAAVSSFGLATERSGRNDLTADGKKFSGNAFYKTADRAYHHGTLLISSDMERVGKYLNVSERKLNSHSVSSVRSRVTNLSGLSSAITVEGMEKRLWETFSEIYSPLAGGKTPESIGLESINCCEMEKLREKYASWQWRMGRKMDFDMTFETRFPWGGVTLCFDVSGGVIKKAKIFSDAMDCGYIARASDALTGVRLDPKVIAEALPGEEGEEAGYDFSETSSGCSKDMKKWAAALDI